MAELVKDDPFERRMDQYDVYETGIAEMKDTATAVLISRLLSIRSKVNSADATTIMDAFDLIFELMTTVNDIHDEEETGE